MAGIGIVIHLFNSWHYFFGVQSQTPSGRLIDLVRSCAGCPIKWAHEGQEGIPIVSHDILYFHCDITQLVL